MAQTNKTNKAQVDSTSSAYDVMTPRFQLGRTLLGGTPAMRDARHTYLPQYERESKTNYNNRLAKAVLFNAYKKTLNGSVARVFSKPVMLSDDMPEVLKEISEDIDRQGSDITTWSRNVFRDGLNKGLTHCLIDYPTIDADNAEEEQEQNPTPFFNWIPPENLIAAYAKIVDGREVLTQIRIRETSVEVTGFEEETIETIRVVEPGTWALYKKDNNKSWKIVEEGVFPLDYIPLMTYYAEREEFMIANPPLSDLGYLNVAHWQFSSDMQNTLTVASFPILAGSGIDTDKEGATEIGPRSLLTTKKADAKWYYVEHTGASIESNQIYLNNLEGQMALEGVNLLRSKPGTQTATQRSLDSAEETSDLKEMAVRFEDFLNNCYRVAADWLDLPESGTVSVNTDGLVVAAKDVAEVEILFNLAVNNKLSWASFFGELKRRGMLSDNIDYQDEVKLVADQPTDDIGMFSTPPKPNVDDDADS